MEKANPIDKIKRIEIETARQIALAHDHVKRSIEEAKTQQLDIIQNSLQQAHENGLKIVSDMRTQAEAEAEQIRFHADLIADQLLNDSQSSLNDAVDTTFALVLGLKAREP